MEQEESWDSKASSDVTGMTEDEFTIQKKGGISNSADAIWQLKKRLY
jgi:hypothetical protein